MSKRVWTRWGVALFAIGVVACGGGGGDESEGDAGGGEEIGDEGGGGGDGPPESGPQPGTANPIVFVTQVPTPDDFLNVASTFGNHLGRPKSAPRGGDLWVRYPDGTLRNLTEEAGYGEEGLQGANSIAVRDPCISYDASLILFSMVVGAPGLGQDDDYFWQLYVCGGFLEGETPIIAKVPFQPEDANNTAPAFASDGRILFTSDRTRSGEAHLYPQLDEYEEAPTNTGLWSLDATTGDLHILNHAPSGLFQPIVDSFGRVVFSRWDHLERDQQTDKEAMGLGVYGTFNYSDESAGAAILPTNEEIFPEARTEWVSYVNANPGYSGPLNGWEPNIVGVMFNDFQLWQMNQDGTEEETLNHIGRQELNSFADKSFTDDPNLQPHVLALLDIANRNPLKAFMQPREDPLEPGTFFGVDGPEFFTHGSGQVVKITGAPNLNPDEMEVTYVTHRDTHRTTLTPSEDHSGFYRNPLPMTDGTLIAAHVDVTVKDANQGTATNPISLYDFRLKELVLSGDHYVAGDALTDGIVKSVQYHDPWQLVSYSGPLWELDPVEVVVRPTPPDPTWSLDAPEQAALGAEGVTLGELTSWLEANDLALLVGRDVTSRDANDAQQPFNLKVSGSSTQTVASAGELYEVAYMQLFQGDQVRGLTGGGPLPIEGRRVLAQPMHDGMEFNPDLLGAPDGAVEVAADGSWAAVVPARRAMSWQLTADDGEPVVRERYWVSFQPGEVRTCASCHGLNEENQVGAGKPQNSPQALRDVLQHLKGLGEL